MVRVRERVAGRRTGPVLVLYAVAFTTPVLYRAGSMTADNLNLSPELQVGTAYAIYASGAVLLWVAVTGRLAGVLIAPISAPRRLGLPSSICDPLLVIVSVAAVFAVAMTAGPFGKDFVADPSKSPVYRAILGVGASVVAPVAEEVSGRWLLYRGLRPPRANDLRGLTRARAVAPALVLSSLAFGLYHYAVAGPARMAVTALIGLILAASYEASGKLWVPMATHIFINTRASLLAEFDTTYRLDLIAVIILAIPAFTALVRTRPRTL